MSDIINIKSRPDKKQTIPSWIDDAEALAQYDKGYGLMFCFQCIKNPKVSMEVLIHAEKLLKKYPDEHSNFVRGLYNARCVMDDCIKEEQKKAATQPADVIRFPDLS